MKLRNVFTDTLGFVIIFALCYLVLCIFANPVEFML